LPVGETTSHVGGAAGARFERARDALFGGSSVEVSHGRVSAVEVEGERWLVRFDDDGETKKGRDGELEAGAVVLATGGVAAGGIAFVWDPERGAHGFRLPFSAPVALALDGEPGDSGGSLYGASLETRGLGVLERVGIHAAPTGAPLGESRPGLFVAGDAAAARPRTVLEAVRSGIRAARAALLKSRA
jgi:glycerol-3-phosphate dehydrogenase subunit B